MKKMMLAVVLTGMFLVACSGAQNPRPSWVDDAAGVGAMSAVGLGVSTREDHAREKAMLNGRSELAQQISTKLQGYIENSFQEVTGASLVETAGQDYTESMKRALYSKTLSGTSAKKFWRDNETGTTYALIVMDPSGLGEMTNQIGREIAEKYLKVAEAKHQEFSARLDEKLEAGGLK